MRYTQQNLPNIIKATERQQRLMGKSWANFKQDSAIMDKYKRVVNKHMYGQMQKELRTTHA